MGTKSIPRSASAYETRFTKNFADAKVTVHAPLISVSGFYAWNDTKIGVDNPGWREQIRLGENASTDYSVAGEDAYPVSGQGGVTYYDATGRTYVRRFEGHPQHLGWNAFPDPAGMDTTLVDRLSRQRFISDYRKSRTAFQSGVFLGELRETVKMLRNPASALRRGIDRYHEVVKKRLRGSRLKTPKDRNRIIRDTWLEYVFGWAPLINDVRDAAKLADASPLAYTEEIRSPMFIPNHKASQKGSHFFVAYNDVTTGFTACTYQGAIRAERNPILTPWMEQFGLSWSNLAPTIWELIPYSFLVDYFTNVGKVIEAISTGPITLGWGCRHLIRGYSREIISLGFDHAAVKSASWPSGAVRYEGYGGVAGELQSRTFYTRTKVTKVSVGIRDLMFKLPGSGTQWLNIAALAKLKQ